MTGVWVYPAWSRAVRDCADLAVHHGGGGYGVGTGGYLGDGGADEEFEGLVIVDVVMFDKRRSDRGRCIRRGRHRR